MRGFLHLSLSLDQQNAWTDPTEKQCICVKRYKSFNHGSESAMACSQVLLWSWRDGIGMFDQSYIRVLCGLKLFRVQS